MDDLHGNSPNDQVDDLTNVNTRRPPGRPKAPGKYYRLSFRWRPGIHPPELREFLDELEAMPLAMREIALAAAMMGGLEQAQEVSGSETKEIESGFDDMFSDF